MLYLAMIKEDNVIYMGGERENTLEHMRRMRKAGYHVIAYATDRREVREAAERVMYG